MTLTDEHHAVLLALAAGDPAACRQSVLTELADAGLVDVTEWSGMQWHQLTEAGQAALSESRKDDLHQRAAGSHMTPWQILGWAHCLYSQATPSPSRSSLEG